MISANQYSIVKWVINSEDYLVPLDTFVRINLFKPEDTDYTKIGIIPFINVFSNNLDAYNFCLVTLPNENLPIGDVNLIYCGQYSFIIETSPDNLVWTKVWEDVFTLVCDEINFVYN